MTGMEKTTDKRPFSWDSLVGKGTEKTSRATYATLQNGEFYGPGGSREEFITWMEAQEPKWEKRKEAHCTQEEFDGVHAFWEKEYTMLCDNHLLPASYLDAYREYRVGVDEQAYEQEKKLAPFKTYHTQLRQACRERRANEKLPDGRNMWDAVDEFFNEKCSIHLDSQDEPCVELKEIGKRCKLLNLEKLPERNTYIFKNTYFLSEMKTGQQVFVNEEYLTSKETQQLLKEAKKHGYSVDPNKTDEVLEYLADKFGLTYNKQDLVGNQLVFKIYMAVLGRLGREFRNRHKDGHSGNNFKINKEPNFNYQFVNMEGNLQGLSECANREYTALISLVAG